MPSRLLPIEVLVTGLSPRLLPGLRRRIGEHVHRRFQNFPLQGAPLPVSGQVLVPRFEQLRSLPTRTDHFHPPATAIWKCTQLSHLYSCRADSLSLPQGCPTSTTSSSSSPAPKMSRRPTSAATSSSFLRRVLWSTLSTAPTSTLSCSPRMRTSTCATSSSGSGVPRTRCARCTGAHTTPSQRAQPSTACCCTSASSRRLSTEGTSVMPMGRECANSPNSTRSPCACSMARPTPSAAP
ncbi:hypothetical protein DMC30DRAFT_93682 [Rhodotorula diobovata]|uniref:Uncharacterized protein n=1 Tax=Rhodotorula diobovata TaxID=5288 RepID=A0A5C5G1D5_9BASI|nr:hypothetical protein DMC30DRAFT_93682 [Rhodotorula diobovata]